MCEQIENYSFPAIEPRTKSQIKQYENLKKKLGVSCKQEDFILKLILNFDWNRSIIIQEIEKIKYRAHGMIDFRVSVTAPRNTVDYCIPDPFKENGWSTEMKTFNDRAYYVYHEMYRYLN